MGIEGTLSACHSKKMKGGQIHFLYNISSSNFAVNDLVHYDQLPSTHSPVESALLSAFFKKSNLFFNTVSEYLFLYSTRLVYIFLPKLEPSGNNGSILKLLSSEYYFESCRRKAEAETGSLKMVHHSLRKLAGGSKSTQIASFHFMLL